MKRLPVFAPDRRLDALIVLGQPVFSDIACASFSIYVLHRSYETKFVSEASFMVVAVNLFALHIFTDQQLGVIIQGKEITQHRERVETLDSLPPDRRRSILYAELVRPHSPVK